MRRRTNVGRVRHWIRGNVLGLVAVFIALGGSAVATNVASERSAGERTAAQASSEATAAHHRRGRRGPRGPRGLRGPQGLQGPVGPATGPAGGDLAGSYPNPTLKAPEGWHEVGTTGEPAFQNSWVNLGAGNTTAAFYIDPQGVVHLKGTIQDGSNNMAAFTLPLGYRPAVTQNFPGVAYAPSLGVANIQVGSTGTVVPFAASTADGVTLDGITFRACGAPGGEPCPP